MVKNGTEKKSDYLKKILIVFTLLFFLLGLFRLNVREFLSLKQKAENSAVKNEDNFAFLNMEHIGVIFENKNLNSAILILPDTGYKYNTQELLVGYTKRQKFSPNINIAENTIYITKEDTSCIYEENCGENFEKILNLAEKYNMIPQTYDLTNIVILSNKTQNTDILLLKNGER